MHMVLAGHQGPVSREKLNFLTSTSDLKHGKDNGCHGD